MILILAAAPKAFKYKQIVDAPTLVSYSFYIAGAVLPAGPFIAGQWRITHR
jgi:hypothetical protein